MSKLYTSLRDLPPGWYRVGIILDHHEKIEWARAHIFQYHGNDIWTDIHGDSVEYVYDQSYKSRVAIGQAAAYFQN